MAADPLASLFTPDTVAALLASAPPAPKQVAVVYVGPFAGRPPSGEPGSDDYDEGLPAGVDITWGQHTVHAWPGEPVEVPEEIAGRPPSGTPGEEGYDPGAGLLAQTANWVEADLSASTVADVLASVGDDPERAAAALASEQLRDRPRKSLVEKLAAIVAQSEESSNG
jgi:hypothetical protein